MAVLDDLIASLEGLRFEDDAFEDDASEDDASEGDTSEDDGDTSVDGTSDDDASVYDDNVNNDNVNNDNVNNFRTAIMTFLQTPQCMKLVAFQIAEWQHFVPLLEHLMTLAGAELEDALARTGAYEALFRFYLEEWSTPQVENWVEDFLVVILNTHFEACSWPWRGCWSLPRGQNSDIVIVSPGGVVVALELKVLANPSSFRTHLSSTEHQLTAQLSRVALHHNVFLVYNMCTRASAAFVAPARRAFEGASAGKTLDMATIDLPENVVTEYRCE